MNGLSAEPRQTCAVEQSGTARLRMQCSDVAEMTFCLVKLLFSQDDLRIVYVASRRNAEALHIKVHIFHIGGRYVELVVRESHHAALVDLSLPFANLFRIAAVCHTHIA